MFRRRPKSPPDPLAHVDPAALPRRFGVRVAESLEARRRYRELLDGLRPGPVRDRLGAFAERMDSGIAAVWDTAQRAAEVERVLRTLGPERVAHEYKQAKRSEVDAETLDMLEERFATVQRLLNALDDTDDRLGRLDVRLGGLVARAAEVALAASGGAEGADELDAELVSVVTELGALRAGLDELG